MSSPANPRRSWTWPWLWLALGACAAAGLALRLTYTSDMEWKEDEYYNYVQTTLIGVSRPWPWVGMPSGVYLPNPGMSVWVFVWLARVAGLFCAWVGPLELARAVALFAWAGILGLLVFAWRVIEAREREPWLWAFALAMVNPFEVFYQRKLWPEPFLPAFTMGMLLGWWRRETLWGAVLWGALGALIGQIHMSGFFLAAGFALFTLGSELRHRRRRANWVGWLLGSCLGTLPLLPWLAYCLRHPTGHSMTTGWSEISQLKFWAFWVTDPFGLVLTNPLGLLRGDSILAQLGDFIRYPLIAGQATYLCGAAHLLVLGCALWILAIGFHPRRERSPEERDGALAVASGLWGFGALMTLTGVNIRRYYMMVAFPLGFLWVTRRALRDPSRRRARALLLALWAGELVISALFIHYVHVHQGALQGDYGEAYHLQQERHERATGERWPDLKLVH